jgi:formylglycine-generating enzyme required for sulfatase activity
LQWSDTLTNSIRWFHLLHVVPDNQPVTIQDSSAPTTGSRFYRAVQVPDTNMVLISGGSFAMGDTFGEGFPAELPVHNVLVSAFYMDRNLVTESLWNGVYAWAVNNGYVFDNPGSGKAANHPVQTVSWYDVVKWCNARSQMDGRTPVYYTAGDQATIYQSGRIDLTNGCVNWAANGYRLPTEAEWEKAARGGIAGARFPWGSTATVTNANYFQVKYLTYDSGGTNGYNPNFATGPTPYTSPAGWFAANAYGLADMAGDVWEWCWDGYDSTWYSDPGATVADTAGPSGPVTNRVLRGGSWDVDASFARCANRNYSPYSAPSSISYTLGFRCVISVR